jgi:hypothetical protein
MMAFFVSSDSVGHASAIAAKSGYFCIKNAKLDGKTGFSISVRALFTILCEFWLRGSTPLGGNFIILGYGHIELSQRCEVLHSLRWVNRIIMLSCYKLS